MQMYQPNASPRTPVAFRTPAHGKTPSTAVRQIDSQLEELDRLRQTLSQTLSHLSEGAVPAPEASLPCGIAAVNTGGRSPEDKNWKKFNELAAQLEQAKAELDELGFSSDDDFE